MQGTAKVFLAVPPSLVAVSRVAPSACCLLVCWLQLLLTLRDLPAPPARPPDLAATSPRLHVSTSARSAGPLHRRPCYGPSTRHQPPGKQINKQVDKESWRMDPAIDDTAKSKALTPQGWQLKKYSQAWVVFPC